MKLRNLLFVAMALFTLAATSCRKEVFETVLKTDPVSLYFAAEAGSDVVAVTTNATSWNAVADSPWITVTPANDGKSFLVEVAENVGAPGSCAAGRTGTIVVSAGDKMVDISVVQSAETVIFLVLGDTDKPVFNDVGGKLHIKVTSNIDYSVTGIPDWMVPMDETKAVHEEYYDFLVLPNKDFEPREATLTFLSSQGESVNVDVYQIERSKAEYTIMVYGCGGGSLDFSTTDALFADLMKGGSNKNVNVTFLYKYSASFQAGGKDSAGMKFDGARRWYAPLEGEMKWDPELDKPIEEGKEADWVKKATELFLPYSEKIGDAGFDLADPVNLSDFINWSVEKFPAEKYVLLMKNHGAGWDFLEDLPRSMTKAQIYDDNKNNYLRLPDAVEGIRQSGLQKVDAIISDECQMATMEVLTEYASVTDLNMAAQEVTCSLGGEYLLEEFKKGSSNGTSLKVILNNVVDDYIQFYDVYTDQGVYDLTKISALNSVVKDFVEFFDDKEEDEDVDWRYVKHMAVTNVMYSSIPSIDRSELMEWRKIVARWNELTDEEREDAMNVIALINISTYGYCLYDLLQKVVSFAESYESPLDPEEFKKDIPTVKGFLEAYDSALKDMAYINCTKKTFENEPYAYASPSVLVRSLNKFVYGPLSPENIYGYQSADVVSRELALSTYKSLAFDEATDWSTFLEGLLKSATPFECPDRQFADEGI